MTGKLGRADRTGFRMIDYTSLLGAEAAERFSGLEPGLTKNQVLAAFKRASSALGIPARLRDVVDLLFKYSYEQDWERGQRPIVWPSNQLLMDELNLSRRQVQYTIRDLVKLGLIAIEESPNGQRRGLRGADGTIVWAYGFDLSPLAVNLERFHEAAAAAQAYRAERTRLRREITIARKAIQQIAVTAEEQGFEGADWLTIASEVEKTAAGAGKDNDLVALQDRLKELTIQRTAVEEAFKACSKSENNSPEGASYCTLITTKHRQFDESNTVDTTPEETPRHRTAQQGRSSGDRPAEPPGHPECGRRHEVEASLVDYRITPRFLLHVSPTLAECLRVEDPDWPDIIEAAYQLRQGLGISDDAWGQGCGAMGRRGAATAVAVIAARQNQIRRPGGYFRGMTRKAEAGKLNLGPSIFKIRDVLEAET